MITGYDAHGNFLPPQKLVDEIERLRAEMLRAEQNWAADWKHERDQIIEECARVAESYAGPTAWDRNRLIENLAAAVRALKDKP